MPPKEGCTYHAARALSPTFERRRCGAVATNGRRRPCVIAALKDKDIEARAPARARRPMREILAVLQKMIKQRQESAEIYGKAGRRRAWRAARRRGDHRWSRASCRLRWTKAAILAAVKLRYRRDRRRLIKDMGKVHCQPEGQLCPAKWTSPRRSAVVKQRAGRRLTEPCAATSAAPRGGPDPLGGLQVGDRDIRMTAVDNWENRGISPSARGRCRRYRAPHSQLAGRHAGSPDRASPKLAV